MDNRSNQLQQLFKEGSELLQAQNAAEALIRFKTALDIDSSKALLHLYTGAALHELMRYEEAVTSYRHALAIVPNMGEAHNNMGNSLMALGRFDEAAASFSRSSALLPSSPVPVTARATALLALGNVAEAEAECRRALLIDPAFAAAHWNLALSLLLQGRYQEGWQEYEWRWQKPDFTSPRRHSDVPLWDGSPLGGSTILLHAEQGFGDAIQFIRYSSMVAKRVGHVVVECHHELVQLIRSVEGVLDAVPFGSPLPPFCCQAPLLSLPLIFGTTLQTVPHSCPYVSIPTDYRRKWSALISAHSTATVRVGIAWAGKRYPDPLRSCLLADFAPLATAPDITFYSLQLGTGSEQADVPPPEMQLIDLTDQIQDFADTAALIEQLDLVISIDTAVAHLAGALGKPVYVLLPFAPDWRWLLERNDSPWYPTMQIFRQNQPGNWHEAITRVHAALDLFVGGQKNPLRQPQRINLRN